MRRRTRWILTARGRRRGGRRRGRRASPSPAARPTPTQPITGAARAKARAAALAHTGGGRVTDTEVGDEESYYEVEVTMPDGRQVDVQLDESFAVVGVNRRRGDSADDGADG